MLGDLIALGEPPKMPEYNFENLDAKLFEHMAVALGQVHIARGLRPFGPGADGGREATFEGRMDYPSSAAPWDGYLVVQCKRKETRGLTPKEEADWAIMELDAEMAKYETAKVPRRIPEYFLFVTNSELSAKPVEGGKDRFVARLAFWTGKLGMREADVWDREKLSRLLDGTQIVAQRFGLLHAGDLVHHAAQAVLKHHQGVETTLSLFLQEELRADQYVRLAQAGHVGDERTPLARVFVDLRAAIHEFDAESEQVFVVKEVQSASDRPVFPSLIAHELQAEAHRRDEEDDDEHVLWRDPSRFVVVGGPGQGKSTLVQHLAQRHRATLLERNNPATLNYDIADTLRIVREGAEASGIGLPAHPRFPFRVVLEEFADALAKGKTASVLEFIAFIVRKRTGRPFERTDAEHMLREMPWFVAFDGLDEVPVVSNRSEVLTAVRLFLGEARAVDADLLVMATTRPQGYEDEFSPAHFNHLYLTPLSVDEALDYAKKFVETKYATDADRRERVIKRLESATNEDATARLMISPLQVTIMAALVDLVGNPPRERYPLFDRYYEVVYQREQERGLGSSEVLAEHRADINALHDRAGLLLQIATESAGQAQGRLNGQELSGLVRERLRTVGYEGVDLNRITESLVEIAINRLVFIVPLEEDQYGFEVRSLQEFAAARGLMRRGTPEQIKQRLLAIAPLPYWRNTVLFAVGLIFAEREDLADTVAQLCREINEGERDPALLHARAGSRLAIDILRDGVVDRRPAHRRSLLETALLLLDTPSSEVAEQLATLYRAEDEGRYVAAVRSATEGSYSGGAGAFLLLAVLSVKNVSWATSLLSELWPAEIGRARWVLEHVAKYLLWDDWQIQSALAVARESTPEWVAEHLAGRVDVPWINAARRLGRHRRNHLIARLDGDDDTVGYGLISCDVDEELILVADSDATHPAWRIYCTIRPFLKTPSSETLADALVATSELPISNNISAESPWPLQSILKYAESPAELQHYAQIVRGGGFGDVDVWKLAEERWLHSGFTVEDLITFDGSSQPFTPIIAERGVVEGQTTMVSHSTTGLEKSIVELRRGLQLVSSERLRKRLAGNLGFALNVAVHQGSGASGVTLSELLHITEVSPQWIDVRVIGVVLQADFSALSDDEMLILGANIPLASRRTNHRIPSKVDYRDSLSELATRTATLLSASHSPDAALRLLAALAYAEIPVPVVHVAPSTLTSAGKASLLALNLLTGGASGLAAAEAGVIANDIFRDERDSDVEQELTRILTQALQSHPLSQYTIQIMDVLLRNRAIPRPLAKVVIDALMLVPQYRTSRFADPDRQVLFGLR
jgi:hypothetical protein